MNPTPPEAKTPGQKAWIAFRFIVFGVNGLLLTLFFSFSLVFRVVEQDPGFASPWISLPLAIAGMLMLLFGIGEWKRPAYLWVFISFPASVALLIACRRILPDLANGEAVLVMLTAIAVYFAVEFYYSERKERDRERARKIRQSDE